MSGNELGPEYASLVPEDLMQAFLVAIVMQHGGSYDLPLAAMELDALGGLDGALHALRSDPLPDGSGVRLMVVARPPEDGPILRWDVPEDRPPAE